ncbi:MAG: methyl-accepting chemotaxis protein, partial [Myxococcaceae bacterium]
MKRRLWLGFGAGLLVLPPIFVTMFWAMGSTEVLLDEQASLVQQIRLGNELERLLDRAAADGGRGDTLAQLRSRARELSQAATNTSTAPSANALSARIDVLGGAGPTLAGGPGTAFSEARQTATAVITETWRAYDESRKKLFEIKDSTLRVNGLVIVGALLFAAAAAYFISRSVTGPLEELTRATQRIAAGDLRQGVHLPADEEFRQLAEAFNQMRENLDGALSRLRGHARDVAEAATSVSAATSQVAAGAQQQSAATEETSSAMEEIAAQIQG